MSKNTSGLARGSLPGRTRTGGRAKGTPNKIPPDVKELCQQYGTVVIDKFVNILNTSENEMAVVAVGREILDRGYGKPKPAADSDTTEIAVSVPVKIEINVQNARIRNESESNA